MNKKNTSLRRTLWMTFHNCIGHPLSGYLRLGNHILAQAGEAANTVAKAMSTAATKVHDGTLPPTRTEQEI